MTAEKLSRSNFYAWNTNSGVTFPILLLRCVTQTSLLELIEHVHSDASTIVYAVTTFDDSWSPPWKLPAFKLFMWESERGQCSWLLITPFIHPSLSHGNAPFLRAVTIVTRAITTLTSEAHAGNTPQHRKLVLWWCWKSWAEHLPRPVIWSLDLIACRTFLQQKYSKKFCLRPSAQIVPHAHVEA